MGWCVSFLRHESVINLTLFFLHLSKNNHKILSV